MSGGRFGVTYGSREQNTDTKGQSTTAAASTVGSIKGRVTVNAGQACRQVGSDVSAPAGDITVTAKKVDIVEGMNSFNNFNGWVNDTYSLAAGGAGGAAPEQRHQLVVDGNAGDEVWWSSNFGQFDRFF